MPTNVNVTGSVAGIGSAQVGGQRPQGPRADGHGAAPNAQAAPAESVTISGGVNKVNDIESKLKSLPDIDEARVERIKLAVASGQYHVDPQRVARKFLEVESYLPGS